jgi:MFS family permease
MMAIYLQKLRMFSRDARLFLLTYALWGGFFGIQGVLFNLYLLCLGHGPEFVGWVNGIGRLIFGLFSLPAGALGGRLGNRRTIIAGMCLGSAGFGLLPLAELITGLGHLLPCNGTEYANAENAKLCLSAVSESSERIQDFLAIL